MNRREALALIGSLPSVGTIARADVKPSSVIVVTCQEHFSQEVAQRIKDTLRRVWPDNRCLVLDAGLELRVIDRVP